MEDQPGSTGETAGPPGGRKSDRDMAREVLHRVKISPELRMRFDQLDRRLSTVAYRDPRTGEPVLTKSGLRNVLTPLTTPQQTASIIATMESALGNRLREDRREGEWLNWDEFLRETGLAQRESDLFRSKLARAQTSEDIKKGFAAAVPALGKTPDIEEKIQRWIDDVSGNATLADGQTVLRALNVSAVNACIEQSVAASWWVVAIFAAACMIITFPAWWLGLAFAGLTVAGWLIVIILNCIIRNG
jgi:hypothetical protein